MKELTEFFHPSVIIPPHPTITMPKNTLDKAIEAVPNFGKRIKQFTEKLRIAQYADGSIYDYRLKIAQAVLFTNKLPEEFTQTDIDYYLSTLLDKNRCSLSFFKHTVFGLKAYYNVMGYKEPKGLVLPQVRKPKRLPRVLSQEQIARLLRNCTLYDKTMLALIYDCALRVGEACRLRWDDICFDRKKLFVFQGKGRKDRYVPVSDQMLVVLKAYRKKYPSDDYVFKSHGNNKEPQRITPGYVRPILKNALTRVTLDHTITIHDLRHSAATHLLENGENIVHVQKRLGHARLTTTMVYLHVADIEPVRHVRLIDVLFPPKQ